LRGGGEWEKKRRSVASVEPGILVRMSESLTEETGLGVEEGAPNSLLVKGKVSGKGQDRPEWHGALLLMLGMVLLIIALAASSSLAHGPLPAVLPRDAPATVFSAERARDNLEAIVGLGVRHSSSPAIDKAQQLVVSMLQNISASGSGAVQIEWLITRNNTAVLSYNGGGIAAVLVPLLVVRISDGTEATKQTAVLVDAHLDSQFFSPGASDNGVAVANSLEIIRAVASMPQYPFSCAVIFNFGCEEEGLEAAHQFMITHPWSTTVKAFIDLESGGAAGSAEFLLRSTGDDINMLYSRVAHPIGFSILQDLFAIGGGGSHFSVYRDYGLPGADLIYAWGTPYYHTPPR